MNVVRTTMAGRTLVIECTTCPLAWHAHTPMQKLDAIEDAASHRHETDSRENVEPSIERGR